MATPSQAQATAAAPKPTVPQLSMNTRGIQLQGLNDLLTLARLIKASGFAPNGFTADTSIAVAIQYGLEVGLTPMAAIQNIAVIGGRPCIYGDGGTALIRASGKLGQVDERFEGEGDSLTAVCILERIDMVGGKPNVTKVMGEFSMADAKRAGLLGKKGPWTDYPKRMLMWRARTYAYRDGFADVLKGLTFREEAEDITLRDAEVVTSTLDFAPAPQAEDMPVEIEDARVLREIPANEESAEGGLF